ncbi:uncharacterized protein L969DRAFT_92198 [Mixia osmundae IAM 14324]|uniref:Uncharacterized protein n=1 Tax=Mixia osmundae (strain CBS 9802 / IAM 14324 / JCM 22182 / KY 12970) TaxID=764103 RepID=G7DT14_MIXOS|nr:uncharacterized protein L969DRAFT_92198 [Mixia osmundae IAM 14324]KEI42773.1 hypothetical protein L969DRAFT_92198 [Mixia osmundae IAM 14324]GAA93893.1 hypothetical protein E5Q_00539 [Mixia osmundae IAM 14324]
MDAGTVDFANDQTFQTGLRAVLRPLIERGASREEVQAVTQRAKAFYLARLASDPSLARPSLSRVNGSATETDHDPPLASSTLATSDATEAPVEAAPTEAYPASFSEIAELIATGAPIPGIKQIPNMLNDAPPSEPVVATQAGAGRKPWEHARLGAPNQSSEASDTVLDATQPEPRNAEQMELAPSGRPVMSPTTAEMEQSA